MDGRMHKQKHTFRLFRMRNGFDLKEDGDSRDREKLAHLSYILEVEQKKYLVEYQKCAKSGISFPSKRNIVCLGTEEGTNFVKLIFKTLSKQCILVFDFRSTKTILYVHSFRTHL